MGDKKKEGGKPECEGSRGFVQKASNRQADKIGLSKSSAADRKKLWIMMGIIQRSSV